MKNKCRISGSLFLLASSLGVAARANVDKTWVWCSPPDPLTYCVDASAAALNADVAAAARIWSKPGTDWTVSQAPNCDSARVIVKYHVHDVIDKLAENDEDDGRFIPTKWGYENVFDLEKPCLQQAELVIWQDTDWTANDRLNAILHELGHALGLMHSTGESNIMHPSNTTTHVLSTDDHDEAGQSFGRSNMAQLHNRYGRRGGRLAFAGVSVSIPAGALATEAVIGLRRLTGQSLPPGARPARGDSSIVAAFQVIPEWEKGQVEPGMAYVQKPLRLRKPIALTIKLKPEELSDLAFTPAQYGRGHKPRRISRKTLTFARLDPKTGAWTPLKTAQERQGLRLHAKSADFGTFAVLGRFEPPSKK